MGEGARVAHTTAGEGDGGISQEDGREEFGGKKDVPDTMSTI
jgi:hypothetical protein